jgi:signal transduction histidine kinase
MGELAATLAHQVRSPATAMRLDLERVHRRLPADATERELVSRALEQLGRLERTVAGSLRVARSSAVSFRPIDVSRPLRRAVDGLSTEAGLRDVDLRLANGSGSFETMGDDSSLEQLFINLIANAVQHAPGGGVTVRADPGERAVTIVDDGSGMSAAALEKAGEPFFSTRAEGTGLGIAIARRIAAAHGATIDIGSEEGRGTSVRITFDAAVRSAAPRSPDLVGLIGEEPGR